MQIIRVTKSLFKGLGDIVLTCDRMFLVSNCSSLRPLTVVPPTLNAILPPVSNAGRGDPSHISLVLANVQKCTHSGEREAAVAEKVPI